MKDLHCCALCMSYLTAIVEMETEINSQRRSSKNQNSRIDYLITHQKVRTWNIYGRLQAPKVKGARIVG